MSHHLKLTISIPSNLNAWGLVGSKNSTGTMGCHDLNQSNWSLLSSSDCTFTIGDSKILLLKVDLEMYDADCLLTRTFFQCNRRKERLFICCWKEQTWTIRVHSNAKLFIIRISCMWNDELTDGLFYSQIKFKWVSFGIMNVICCRH